MDAEMTCGELADMLGDICDFDYGAPDAVCGCMCQKESFDSHDHDHDGVVDHDSADHDEAKLPECVCPSFETGATTGSEMCEFGSSDCALASGFPDGCPSNAVRCSLTVQERAVSGVQACVQGCQRLGARDYAACESRCYGIEKAIGRKNSAKAQAMSRRSSKKSRRERAVGAGWQNGNCVYYGSSVVGHGSASVTDWGTGWSESSCQSECDYSSTAKMCQYEFASQKCLAIGFFTNEVYGDGSYDGLCYIK